MASGETKLKHANGTLVTAQEAYDAFMNTRVLIVWNKTAYEAINMVWYDNNSAQTDPNNVGYVKLFVMRDKLGTLKMFPMEAWNPSLVPA